MEKSPAWTSTSPWGSTPGDCRRPSCLWCVSADVITSSRGITNRQDASSSSSSSSSSSTTTTSPSSSSSTSPSSSSSRVPPTRDADDADDVIGPVPLGDRILHLPARQPGREGPKSFATDMYSFLYAEPSQSVLSLGYIDSTPIPLGDRILHLPARQPGRGAGVDEKLLYGAPSHWVCSEDDRAPHRRL
jgi:hypothetical protein